jgi:hypothetical protein
VLAEKVPSSPLAALRLGALNAFWRNEPNARLAGDAPPTAGPGSASLPARFVKTTRFRNWKTMAIELAGGFYVSPRSLRARRAKGGRSGTRPPRHRYRTAARQSRFGPQPRRWRAGVELLARADRPAKAGLVSFSLSGFSNARVEVIREHRPRPSARAGEAALDTGSFSDRTTPRARAISVHSCPRQPQKRFLLG